MLAEIFFDPEENSHVLKILSYAFVPQKIVGDNDTQQMEQLWRLKILTDFIVDVLSITL